MKRAVVFLVACGDHSTSKPAASPPPSKAAPAIDREALLEGKLPEGAPETDLINAQCRICHSVDYLTQQRLSEAAWKKTIDKMRTFGAVLDDAQTASLVAFATRYWNPDLPERTWKPGPPPPGAVPAKSRSRSSRRTTRRTRD